MGSAIAFGVEGLLEAYCGVSVRWIGEEALEGIAEALWREASAWKGDGLLVEGATAGVIELVVGEGEDEGGFATGEGFGGGANAAMMQDGACVGEDGAIRGVRDGEKVRGEVIWRQACRIDTDQDNAQPHVKGCLGDLGVEVLGKQGQEGAKTDDKRRCALAEEAFNLRRKRWYGGSEGGRRRERR